MRKTTPEIQKKRTYPGEMAAKSLIAWLNYPEVQLRKALANPPDHLKTLLQGKKASLAITPAVRERRERVETIIRLWQSLTDYVSEVTKPHRREYRGVPPPWEIDGGHGIHQKLAEDTDRINSLLKRYSGYTMLVGVNDLKSLTRVVSGHGARQLADKSEIRNERDEWDAVGTVIRLASDGNLWRLQRCEYCHLWLYKRFKTQTCCGGGKCRQSKYRSSSEWKKHRREWSRENYRVHKKIDLGLAPERKQAIKHRKSK